jgi:hypothetical protein
MEPLAGKTGKGRLALFILTGGEPDNRGRSSIVSDGGSIPERPKQANFESSIFLALVS